MKRWDFKVIDVNTLEDESFDSYRSEAELLEEKLKELGALGWDLVWDLPEGEAIVLKRQLLCEEHDDCRAKEELAEACEDEKARKRLQGSKKTGKTEKKVERRNVRGRNVQGGHDPP